LVGSLLAPTTAKYGAEKKALAAVSVVILIFINFPFERLLCRKQLGTRELSGEEVDMVIMKLGKSKRASAACAISAE
jgi:hypothetical protein